MAEDTLDVLDEPKMAGGRQAQAMMTLGAEKPPAGDAVTEELIADGLAWFMEDAEADVAAAVATITVDVAPAGRPARMLTVKIRPIGPDVLKRAREEGERAANRAQRRQGSGADPHRTALYIAAYAIVEPDLLEAARLKGVAIPADATLAAMQVLAHRFQHKPMLIDQISDRVLGISGLDDADVADVGSAAVRAGKP